jgi:hypothetical protein
MNDPVIKAFKEVQKISIKPSKTIQDIMNEFYGIMRKHGVKQGTQSFNSDGSKGGIAMSSPQWIICQSALIENIKFGICMFNLTGNTPKDLEV